MKIHEVEFKYDAKDMSLEKVNEFFRQAPCIITEAHGTDYFYSNKTKSKEFIRHRKGSDTNELTFKLKINVDDNFVRVENNVCLDRRTTSEEVAELCKSLGYDFNTKLTKHSFIYNCGWYVASYYICYDDNRLETARFFEIEVESELMTELVLVEKLCKDLGIGEQTRIKASLFEMYRKM